MIGRRRSLLLIGALLGIAGAIILLERTKPVRFLVDESDIVRGGASLDPQEKERRYERAKEISTPDAFLNTERVTIEELIGKKVVLVDFWTYSCINCQRTFPYLNAWYEKYKDMGLEIIGIHTPEFPFEQKKENVERALRQFGLQYPVVLDNDYSTWTAYRNQYWPRKYLIDIDGFIVYDHIGEGGYDETEEKIQELLKERMDVLGETGEIRRSVTRPKGAESLQSGVQYSPEIYFGAGRNQYLANGRPSTWGVQDLALPERGRVNELLLGGRWEFDEYTAKNLDAGAVIRFMYQAEKVFFVAEAEHPVPVTVLNNGKVIQRVIVEESGLYRLIEDSSGMGQHVLELRLEAPGLRAFTLTFG